MTFTLSPQLKELLGLYIGVQISVPGQTRYRRRFLKRIYNKATLNSDAVRLKPEEYRAVKAALLQAISILKNETLPELEKGGEEKKDILDKTNLILNQTEELLAIMKGEAYVVPEKNG